MSTKDDKFRQAAIDKRIQLNNTVNQSPYFRDRWPAPSAPLWQEIKADALINGGDFSFKRLLKLLLFHSGFQLLVAFRIQYRLRRYGGIGNFLANVVLKFATDLTGCHFYPDAYFEGGIRLPHATGIVIGQGTIIRSGATILQNVTLGRRNIEFGGCPELRQGCAIFAGAQVLGKIVIGEYAKVGANAVVLQSVPDHAIAVGVPARIIQKDPVQAEG